MRLRRPSLLTASLLLVFVPSLLLFAAVLGMYLFRKEDALLIDRLLPNYFAYYQDLPVAPVVLLFLLFAFVVRRPKRNWTIPEPPALLVAAAVFLVCLVGTWMVFRHFALSRDEFMAEFDAQILRGGALMAPLPERWLGFGPALLADFVLEARGAWASAYLPGNAALRALFGPLTAPMLAAASVILVYAIARRLLPENRSPAIVAALLLVSSAQFLIAAMTPYAMTAHLAFNLAWLWLVLRERAKSTAAAGLVSFGACGLHQMAFHPLFALPFLPWLWFTGRRRAALFLFATLVGAALFWLFYWSIAPLTLNGADVAAAAQSHLSPIDRIEILVDNSMRPVAGVITVHNYARLISWQNPLTWVLACAALLSIRRQPAIIWALAGGIVLTLAAMQLLMPIQSHGWGYRYLHGLLGNLALLAAFGWQRLAGIDEVQIRRLRMLFAVSLALSLVLLFPARAWQAHRWAAPYSEADRRIARIDADVVIIEDRGRWYAADLVRNDPFLDQRPIRLLARKLPLARAAELCRTSHVVLLEPSSLALAPLRSVFFRGERQEVARRHERLAAAGCG